MIFCRNAVQDKNKTQKVIRVPLKPTEDNKDQLEIIDPALGDIRNVLIDELLTVYGAPNQ